MHMVASTTNHADMRGLPYQAEPHDSVPSGVSSLFARESSEHSSPVAQPGREFSKSYQYAFILFEPFHWGKQIKSVFSLVQSVDGLKLPR